MDWPVYTQLGEWGCESCHAPHFAATAEQLLIFTATSPEFSCTTSGCHSAAPGPPHATPQRVVPTNGAASRGRQVDVGAQVRKASAHHERPEAESSTSGETANAGRTGIRSVACADCHNPHIANSQRMGPNGISGLLQGVAGVDRSGAVIRPAYFEYEICFKCHGDNSGDVPYVRRVVPGTNARLSFDPINPSYHPVIEMGRNQNIPSIPSSLSPSSRASDVISCTACHADDEGGSRGPHGSSFAPILKERYEAADGTPESYENFALCYRCHERNSIMADISFRRKALPKTPSGGGHSGHLRAGASCAACHDPHGVNMSTVPGSANTGSHAHLINFDAQVVLPAPGRPFPIYTETGMFSGTCTLVCHGVTHTDQSYP